MRSCSRKLGILGAIGVIATTLGACSTNSVTTDSGIGFREERFAEMEAMRTYRECRDEALLRDEQARQSGSAARYIASARLIESCEAELGPEGSNVALEERMRAYALSIQNHVKGGDLESARRNLETFEKSFDGYDLYYANGASFAETMRVLLGEHDEPELGQFSMLNVDEELKAELRRIRYWARN